MINKFRIKVCGITDENNFSELKKYQIDYFGFIFYEKSPRYILNNPDHIFKYVQYEILKLTINDFNYFKTVCTYTPKKFVISDIIFHKVNKKDNYKFKNMNKRPINKKIR